MNDTTNPQPQTGTSGDDKDYETLLAELEESKTKLTELTQISQQALADLQNFKKRSEDEKAKFIVFANATLISDLLPILDNINRATTSLPQETASKEWANGIVAIFKQLEETLKIHGLETIPAIDQQFDPNLHEAIMTDEGPSDKILKEMEKGYKIADRVIRRSKVTVGNQKTESPAQNQAKSPVENTTKPVTDENTVNPNQDENEVNDTSELYA